MHTTAEIREAIRDYYRDADLWLPEDASRRVYRLEKLLEDGSTCFFRLRDRVSDKETLRRHLMEHVPLNAYFSVSCWLNPSKTSYKTYKKPWDGRRHADKNGFMFSDQLIDFDHHDTHHIEECDTFLGNYFDIDEDDRYFVFSGDGYHINIKRFHRYTEIRHPIEREKKCDDEMQQFVQTLIDHGFDFDSVRQNDKWNSPSADTRRVRKLPQTLTKYGNVAQIVPKEHLHTFEPVQAAPAYNPNERRYRKDNIDEWVHTLASPN